MTLLLLFFLFFFVNIVFFLVERLLVVEILLDSYKCYHCFLQQPNWDPWVIYNLLSSDGMTGELGSSYYPLRNFFQWLNFDETSEAATSQWRIALAQHECPNINHRRNVAGSVKRGTALVISNVLYKLYINFRSVGLFLLPPHIWVSRILIAAQMCHPLLPLSNMSCK